MARRSRKSRSDAAGQITASASPFIKRSLPFVDILDNEKIEALERQVDWLIEDVGIAFRDDPVALDLWRVEGAKLDGDIIRAPADWVCSLCAKAPNTFTQIARNPERSVEIGGNNQVFAPIYGAPLSAISNVDGVTMISRHSATLSV